MRLTQAQVAHIQSLEKEGRRITAPDIVTDAKSKSSPLHDLFDWDVKRAASKHWLWQAREILGAVEIVMVTHTSTIKTPVYVHIPGEGYQAVASLRDDTAKSRESLIYTLEVAAGHLRRAMDLASPLGLDAEIDRLLRDITGLVRITRDAAAA